MTHNDDYEPDHTSSPTDEMLTQFQLFGRGAFYDEPDTRSMPDSDEIAGTVADIFDALAGTLTDTRLEPDLHDLLWSMVDAFHRAMTASSASSTTTRTRKNAASANRTAPNPFCRTRAPACGRRSAP